MAHTFYVLIECTCADVSRIHVYGTPGPFLYSASYPGPEEGLVTTACTCANSTQNLVFLEYSAIYYRITENSTHAQTVVTRPPFGPGYEANSSYMYYLMYEEQKCTCGASHQLTCSAFSGGCTTSPLVVVSLWPSSTCIPL